MLCEPCSDLFRGEVSVVRRGALDFHEKDIAWESSVEQLSQVGDCFLCHRIYQNLLWRPDNLWQNATQPLVFTLGLRKTATQTDFPTLNVYVHGNGRKKHLSLMNLTLKEIKVTRVEQLEPFLDPLGTGQTTDSSSTLRMATKWLKDCINNHAKCRIGSTKLPTRLLELNAPIPDHVRVLETASLRQKPTYMALSHCWGKVKLLTLTSETSNSLFTGIPVSVLPPTFREAVTVALNLGASFLWIDSLCILQDSVEDWQHEAPLMCDVYRGSICNIGASASSDRTEGLFRHRDARLIRPCIVKTTFTNCENFRGLLGCEHVAELPHANTQLIFYRGWVVQERLLAPRMLHFGSEYIFWECESHSASEIYPKGLDIFMSGWPLKNTDQTSDPAGEYKRDRETWCIAVPRYLNCALTNPSDKLVAFSGVARHFRSLGGADDYMAGLWRREFPYNLLWGQRNEEFYEIEAPVRSAKYRGPSWSWANLDRLRNVTLGLNPSNPEGSPLDWDYQAWPTRATNTREALTILDIQVSHLTADPYGEVTAASLQVKGILLKAQFTLEGPKTRCDQFAFQSSSKVMPVSSGAASVYFDTWQDRKGSLQELFFLPVALGYKDVDLRVLEHAARLLLTPTEVNRGQYQRLGLVTIRGEHENPEWLQASKPNMTGDSGFGDEREGRLFKCDSFDGAEYTISIV